ncbi:hypothetical protein G5B30_07620 [Sphingobacterium sp. SGG-5]|uniref:D-alanyl-D-alanine carboxypeptidase n=1 Tax=Sphingobacterium sp. SGG-5 TaxID=2710881 RepID=UPI0013EC2E26|nr:D-alanyl-D-alanine carboxypeptidase [Sphingobacterium sp. SGG-5]NGM61781.1 hypothetical protein [Sphingobacterium sp. SGG-5]
MNKLTSIIARCIAVCVMSSYVNSIQAQDSVFDISQDPLLNSAYVGFKVVDLDSREVLYAENSHKHFVPASNTKLWTMYTTLQLCGDSIPGWSIASDAHTLYIEPNGDPTFLQREFKEQKLFDLLKSTDKTICFVLPSAKGFGRLGSGWSWGTWQSTGSPERSVMPIYGNLIRFYRNKGNIITARPSYFNSSIQQPSTDIMSDYVTVLREEHSNTFRVIKNTKGHRAIRPFTLIDNDSLVYLLLKDTLQHVKPDVKMKLVRERPDGVQFQLFHTVPTDQLAGIMMKRSDNFYAEQMLLMSGKVKFGTFDETKIHTYVKEDLLKDVWVRGKWVDGSGLSRSNLISPDEFINLLQLIYNSKDFERVKKILPSGNEGTLEGFYKGYESNIDAKTGGLTDHISLTGYLKTKSGKNLAFSFLVNNIRDGRPVFRKKMEEVITRIIDNY